MGVSIAGREVFNNSQINSGDINNPDIDGGTIDGATIATSNITVGAGKTLNVSSGTFTLANDQISGDKVEGGTINAITINTLTSTTVNGTTFDTNVAAAGVTLAGTTLSADGTDSNIDINITPKGTGSVVMSKVDINAGAIDGTTIGAASASTIVATTITANTGIVPDADDGAYLGQAGTAFSDLFLAEGGVINWDSGDATLTQTGDALDLAGAAFHTTNILVDHIGEHTGAHTVVFDNSITVPAAGLIVGASTPFSDSAGTLTLQNIDALDATTESTIEAAIDTLANLTSIQGQTVTLSGELHVEAATHVNQDLTSDASPTFVTVKLSGLTDGYIPKHTADATGLENTNVYSDGNNVGLAQTSFGTSAAKVLAIGSGTAPTTSPADAVQMWSQNNTGQGASGLAQLYIRDEYGISGPVMHALDQRDCENSTEIIQYPIPTSGYMLKAAADGSPATATNTDTDVADAVTKKHTQNTDTGTTATSWKINSGGNEADLQTTGLTADRDYKFPDIDTMLVGAAATAQNNFEIIEYTAA